uniref:Uncharacterized protein n=1 Tax=Rhinolophus ferrumequinum TaxID=59479 RepID=A0A671DPG3_RHIFE
MWKWTSRGCTPTPYTGRGSQRTLHPFWVVVSLASGLGAEGPAPEQPQGPHLVGDIALLLGLQLILQLPHPGLQLLQLLLATLEGDLLSLIQPVLQVLNGLLHVLLHALQVIVGPDRIVQMDLGVTLHLLLHPQGLVAAARLGVQGGLQRVHHSQVVALGLLHLLVLLGQLPLNLCLDLVELQLGPEDLALLVLQGGLVGAEGRERGSEAESWGTRQG